VNQIAVDSGGHTDAIDGFYRANHDTDAALSSLFSSLGDCTQMAGTDSGGVEWASGYDDAATNLVFATVDLVNSLGSMANLINGNLKNHENADFSAALPYHPYAGSDEDGDPDPEHYSVSTSITGVPSAAGGNGDEPHGWGLIASHLEGFLWPDADTGRLRDAAAAWSKAAEAVGDQEYVVAACRSSIGTQRSPEISLAQSACSELEGHIRDIAEAMREMATACSDYAQHVDDHHDEIIGILKELLAWSAVDQVAGGLLSVVTLGGAEAGAQAIEAGLIARTALRIVGVLRRLKSLATGIAAKIALTAGKALKVSAGLAKFVKAEAVAARLEKAGVLITLKGRKLAGVVTKPAVSDRKLQNLVDNFYKHVGTPGRHGNGTTADAIRYEIATGKDINGSAHVTKGRETIRGLRNWLRRHPDASPEERDVAQGIIDDLLAALGGN
jgi:hypothetical protein